MHVGFLSFAGVINSDVSKQSSLLVSKHVLNIYGKLLTVKKMYFIFSAYEYVKWVILSVSPGGYRRRGHGKLAYSVEKQPSEAEGKIQELSRNVTVAFYKSL